MATGTLSACSDDAPSILSPRSEAARRVEGLWWLTFWTSVVVVVVVVVLIAVAVRRSRRPTGEEGGAGDGGGAGEGSGEAIDRRAVPWGGPFIVVAGLVVSGAILAGTFYVSLRALNALAAPSQDPALAIEVVGRNWWWEVRYPNGAVTANEIHIPVGQPVEVKLSTADVIHSFWVPQLNVKQDQVPGMENRIWLQADEPGRYRGQCAEFCGLQHARMVLYVEAQPPQEFQAWMAREGSPAREPATPAARAGRDVFLRSSCAGCHAVRGTTATGNLGPDLTHVASRRTIGAGVLSLNAATMEGFVRNAQDAKPGASMPPTELAPEQVRDVVEYLMGLN